MMKLNKIPSQEQLIEISNSINKTLLDTKKDNISVIFEYEKDIIRQIDEDFFYKNNDINTKHIPCDEVQLNVLGIVFKFIPQDGNSSKKER